MKQKKYENFKEVFGDIVTETKEFGYAGLIYGFTLTFVLMLAGGLIIGLLLAGTITGQELICI